MPKKKKELEVLTPGPYAIALSRLGPVYAMEQMSQQAFMAGRQKEAKDAYEGAGYTFDITENEQIPKLEPATPPKRKKDPYSTPERKRGPISTPTKGSPVIKPEPLKYRPDPTKVYTSLTSARSQLGKMEKERSRFEPIRVAGFQPWQEPVLDVAGILPVGESIDVDFGPPTNPRQFHAKVSRVPH